MAIYLFRNQGGTPRLIHDTNYQLPSGTLISRVSSLSVEERRPLDIFEYSEVTENESSHQFQERVQTRLVYDIPFMTAVAYYVYRDRPFDEVRNYCQTEILSHARQAETDGFIWEGPVIDAGGTVVGNKGRLQIREKDKIDASYVSNAMASGILSIWDWEVEFGRYIRLTSPADVAKLSNAGFVYMGRIMAARRLYTTKVQEVENAPGAVKKLADILDSARLAFSNIPGRWKPPYTMGV